MKTNEFVFFIFISSFISLFMVRKHILLCLMMLQLMVISLLILIYFFLLNCNFMYVYVLLMSMFMCEGVLGLGSLVYFIRFYRNNYLNSMFMM